MLYLALLAQLSAPMPVDSTNWFTARDLPIGVMAGDQAIVVKYGVGVAPDGQVVDCRIEGSSGNPDLDRKACQVARERAHFRPAKDSKGRHIHGIYRTNTVLWFGDGKAPNMEWPDAELTVKALPRGVPSPALVKVVMSVDAAGRASNCQAASGESRAAMVKVACDQLVGQYQATPGRDSSGAKVATVQNATVLFRSE